MNYDTVVCQKYLKNIAAALRRQTGASQKTALKDMPEMFANITIPVVTLENEAGKTWLYNEKAYVLVQHYYDLSQTNNLTDAQLKDHGNYYAVSTDEETLVPQKIVVATPPYRRFYTIKRGEKSVSFKSEGLTVNAVYGNGNIEAITNYALSIKDGANFTKDDVGEAEIKVTYSACGLAFETSFYVEVCDPSDNCIVKGDNFSEIAKAIRKNRNTQKHYRVAEMSLFPFMTKEKEKETKHDTSEVTEDKEKLYYCQIDKYPNKYYYQFTDEDDEAEIDFTGLSVGFYTVGDTVTREDVTDKCEITPKAGIVRLAKTDAGTKEIRVEYTDASGKTYTMYFEIAFIYLETGIAPPTGISLVRLPDNVFYTLEKGQESTTIDHAGLKVCANWNAPEASTDEKRERLTKKYFNKYPDMKETVVNGRHILTRDITKECIVDPSTGSKLFNREGAGEYNIHCSVDWVDPESFSRFTAGFYIYFTDKNTETGEEVVDHREWKDPQYVDEWEKTEKYDPVIESHTWTDPDNHETYVTNYDNYGNSTTSSYSYDTPASGKLKSIRYTKSIGGAIGSVGDVWECNKYYEVTGKYDDGTQKVLTADKDYTLSIKDGTVWKKPGVYYQTATAVENEKIKCKKRIRISDLGELLTGSLAECMRAFTKHARESNVEGVDYGSCNWYIWFQESDLLEMFCGKHKIIRARVICDARVPNNGKYYGKDLDKPIGIMDLGEKTSVDGDSKKMVRAARCIWWYVNTADYEGAELSHPIWGSMSIPKNPTWVRGGLDGTYDHPGDGLVWFGWGWWLKATDKYIYKFNEETGRFGGMLTGSSFLYA